MTTKRHALYLKRYPERIARERRMRKIKVANYKLYDKGAVRFMRSVLNKYLASKPKQEKTRAGKPTMGSRIKNLFRKPTI